jgi:sigma-B regulation protein RsbQ
MMTAIQKRFNVQVSGKGTQPIVFAHGLGGCQVMWRYIAPVFEEEYKVVLFDYFGTGKCSLDEYRSPKYDTLEGHADDLLQIFEDLKLNDIIFVGHSASSMIGMLASFKAPGLFSKFIMLGPSPYYMNDTDYVGGFEKHEIDEVLSVMKSNMHNWAEVFSPKIIGTKYASELSDELRDSFCNSDHTITYKFAEQTFRSDFRNQLSNISVPTLIMQGANDIIAPPQVGAYMQKKIPNSTLYMMKAEGHYAHLAAPEETVQLIKQYLNQQ